MRQSVLFVLLLVLSLVKPVDADNMNRYIGAALLLIATALFVRVMIRRARWREYWEAYRLEIVVLGTLSALYAISVLRHWEVYGGWYEVLAFGVPPVALGLLFVMAWVLFGNRTRTEKTWPAWLILIGLNVVAIIHAVDYEVVRPVIERTVAADASYPERDVRSLFRGTTIYGVLAALVAVYGTGRLWLAEHSRLQFALLLLLVATALIGGILSGSRNFVWTLFAGLIVLGAFGMKKRPWVWLGAGVAVVIGFHAAVWFSPKLAREYGQAFPYMQKLHEPSEIVWGDLVPAFSMRGLANRPRIWQGAVESWRTSPWFGVGPGVFRLNSGLSTSAGVERVNNTHNIFLQVLVDVGIVGLALFLILVARVFLRVRDPVILAVLVMVLASHLFDNFFDKSMGFVLIVAWLLREPALRPDESGAPAAA